MGPLQFGLTKGALGECSFLFTSICSQKFFKFHQKVLSPSFDLSECFCVGYSLCLPCSQAILCKGLAEETRTSFSELGKNATDAQCALQFVRTTPGILTALAGMRTMAHVEENTGILSYPAVPMSGSVA